MQTMPELLHKLLFEIDRTKGLGRSADVVCFTKDDECTLAVDLWHRQQLLNPNQYGHARRPNIRTELFGLYAVMVVEWDAAATLVRPFNDAEIAAMGDETP